MAHSSGHFVLVYGVGLLGYANLLGTTRGTSASFSHSHGERLPWRLIAAIFVSGLLARDWIWDERGPRWPAGLAYQLPFILVGLLEGGGSLSAARNFRELG